MVGLFVRLKIRLTRNRLRRGGAWATLGFIGIWLLALAAGLLFGFLSAVIVHLLGSAGAAASFTLAGLAWVVGPVVAAALDETIEPRRLELLPISAREMVSGLLAAALVGPGALITFLFVIGTMVTAHPGWVAVVPALLVAATFVIWCLASSRWATTLITDLLTSRRARDVAVVAGAVLLAASAAVPLLLNGAGRDISASIRQLGRMGSFTPPGALGSALYSLAEGEWWAAGRSWLYGLAALAAVVRGWNWSLARIVTRAPGAEGARGPREAGRQLVPRLFRSLRPSLGAMVGKEFRSMRRDPRFRSQAIGFALTVALLGLGAGRFLVGTEYGPFLAVAVGWVAATLTGFNQFGLDDRSFWGYVVTGVDLRRVLEGKNLTIALLGAPAIAALALAAGLLAGDLRHVPAAVLAALAVLAIWLAVGNVVSILGAFPLPESNLFGHRNVSGSTFLASIAGLLVAGVLTAPVVVSVVVPLVAWGWWQGWLGAGVGAGVGWLLYRLSLAVSAGLLDSRTPRLLEILDHPAS